MVVVCVGGLYGGGGGVYGGGVCGGVYGGGVCGRVVWWLCVCGRVVWWCVCVGGLDGDGEGCMVGVCCVWEGWWCMVVV